MPKGESPLGKRNRWTLGNDWPGKRCGAKSKRTGKPCRAIAMKNGRCKFHGGKCTGPKTPEGRDRQRRASTTHTGRAKPGNPVAREKFGTEAAGPFYRDPEIAKAIRDRKEAIESLENAVVDDN